MAQLIDTDVLVIGAGPIGLSAAHLMADQGLKVTLVEKNPGTSDLPRAISATDETLRVMAEIGIMDRLGPEMLLNTGARYFGRNEQLLAEIHPARMVLGQPGKNQFDQPVMENLLHEAAQNKPNIDLRFNTEAFTIRETKTGAETVLITEEGKALVHSKWVVAADGGRSPIRAQLGITLEGSTQVQKWIVVDILNSDPAPEPFSEFHCNGSRPVVIVPGVKSRRRYEFMLLPGESEEKATTTDFIIGLIAPYEKVAPADIRRAAVYVAHQRIAATFRRGRVILIGDAAHLMPPFAGQALNAGVRDAANIAWKLAANIREGAPETLIDTYEQERRPHAADMVRLSHLIGKVVMATNTPLVLARDIGIRASGLFPPLKKWITEMRFLRQPRYTAGCVLPPAKSQGAAAQLVGSSVPQPLIGVAEHGEVPLDHLLGSSWALVRILPDRTLEILTLGSDRALTRGTDRSGLFDHLPTGTTLIIRPDRYVAAATDRAGEKTALRDLTDLVPSLTPEHLNIPA